MCIEDIRIGRRKYNRVTMINLPTSWTKILEANPRRTHVMFASQSTGLAVVFDQMTTDVNYGFPVLRTIPPLEFDVEQHGQYAAGEFYAYGSVAGIRLTIVETILQEE